MFRILAVVGAVGLIALISSILVGDEALALVSIVMGCCAVVVFMARNTSKFLQIFIIYFALESVALTLARCARAAGAWPEQLDWLAPPTAVVVTVAMFSIVPYGLSYFPAVRAAMVIADRYFRCDRRVALRILFDRSVSIAEGQIAIALVYVLLAITQAQLIVTVASSFLRSDIYNALQSYNSEKFWVAVAYLSFNYAGPFILLLVLNRLAAGTLAIRWRAWLTHYYQDRWLSGDAHYRMTLARPSTDNIDQRIQEDVSAFIDGGTYTQTGHGVGVYSVAFSLLSNCGSLVSFAIILWQISSKIIIPGLDVHIPGFLFWCSLIYAVLATVGSNAIGRPLVGLSFARQHIEADFRFSLARIREYGEQIALLSGANVEKSILSGYFAKIRKNFFDILKLKSKLFAFTGFIDEASSMLPYFVLGGLFFSKTITMGDLTQSINAFLMVSNALTFFVTYYSSLAEFRSVLQRLTTFDEALERVSPRNDLDHVRRVSASDIELRDVRLALPDGRSLSEPFSLRLAHGRHTLIVGPSGTGKSVLFRVLADIWPYWSGHLSAPEKHRIMNLPQAPYIPSGSLITAVCYPASAGMFDEEEVKQALEDVGLEKLTQDLHADQDWGLRLSGGEQQRVAIARALLVRPSWLLLDEATAAMDPALEQHVYELLLAKLPDTTLVSIAHRETLRHFHSQCLTVTPSSNGPFTICLDRFDRMPVLA